MVAFQDCVDEDRNGNQLGELRKATYGYIALAIDKILNYNSTFSIWHAKSEIIANTFNTHGFPFKSSYSEMALAQQGLGAQWALSEVDKCLIGLLDMAGQGEVPAPLLSGRKS